MLPKNCAWIPLMNAPNKITKMKYNKARMKSTKKPTTSSMAAPTSMSTPAMSKSRSTYSLISISSSSTTSSMPAAALANSEAIKNNGAARAPMYTKMPIKV